ncbi:MalY/PatB family protein [Enterococcus sp. LJL90]
MTDFNQVINRKQTNSVKWDRIAETYQEEDLLPLWVADMDFFSPAFVTDAFRKFLDTGVLGYSEPSDSLYQAIIDWQQTQHDFTVAREDILFSVGVVPSIAAAVQAYTEEGDAVLIHDPVYFPFSAVVKENKRKLVRNPLKEENGCFVIDFAAMEQAIQEHQVKLFILCNPHNPGGRVWKAEELKQMGELCEKYGVILISDEIHQDLIFEPNQFTSFQNAYDAAGKFSIILTAATKTFNLAGIKNSMVFIKDPELKQKFVAVQQKNHDNEINTFGLIGTEAAYRGGAEWLAELLAYLAENVRFVTDYFHEHLPKVNVMTPQGTYLLWLDFSAYGLSDKELEDFLVHQAKVVLNTGISFGPKGTGHMRMNLAAPKATIQEGLTRIKTAFDSL